MNTLKRFLLLSLVITISLVGSTSANAFVMRKIDVLGLQGVNYSTVMHYMPVKVGDDVQPGDTGHILSALYATGFFSNVALGRQGDTLVINVQERPVIGLVRITGNKKIATKNLQKVLTNIGLVEGAAYDSSILDGLKQSLEHEYASLGQYGAIVTTKVVPQPRNRVEVDIMINEGHAASIREIKIIGNHTYSQWRLLRQFKLTTWRPWSFITHSNDFSQDKLNTDLDTMTKFYMDHGYLRFHIVSSQVNLTPDNKSVNIIITVNEGSVYHISGFALSGELLSQQDTITKAIPLTKGETFSRQKLLDIADAVKHFYGNQGYAFTTVTPVPTIDDNNHTVFITYKVDPGKRVYVRQIIFSNNTKTQDIVLRREMRQEEGGLYSLGNIDEGKRRLMNLGYLQNVDVKTIPVPGHPDQVDLNYDVSEMSSATASAQVGYSDMNGFLYGANISESNLLGTGKQVSLGFQNSLYAQNYNFSYVNPYYTESGISRAISVFTQHITPGKVNITAYTSNNYGVNVSYGVPVSEYSGINFGYGYQYIDIDAGESNSPSVCAAAMMPGPTFNQATNDICNFMANHGSYFNQTTLNGGWERTTYDRAMLPTRGTRQVLSAQVGVPILPKNLDFYKLAYQAAWYQPLGRGFIFHLEGDFGYGNGIGSYHGLPFFKNYFAGGIDSVRSYEGNTLGPRDIFGDSFGGNILTTANASIIIPTPYSDKFRLSAFIDGGNVFLNQLKLGQIRYSAGLGIKVYVPMLGLLEFALAEPLNKQSGDQTEIFQFSVGTSF
jgi:outer membrane protein insertion porin family